MEAEAETEAVNPAGVPSMSASFRCRFSASARGTTQLLPCKFNDSDPAKQGRTGLKRVSHNVSPIHAFREINLKQHFKHLTM